MSGFVFTTSRVRNLGTSSCWWTAFPHWLGTLGLRTTEGPQHLDSCKFSHILFLKKFLPLPSVLPGYIWSLNLRCSWRFWASQVVFSRFGCERSFWTGVTVNLSSANQLFPLASNSNRVPPLCSYFSFTVACGKAVSLLNSVAQGSPVCWLAV